MKELENKLLLGKSTDYPTRYDASLLCPFPRQAKRAELGLDSSALLPFKGEDIWNGYEISWLNSKGKPVVAMGEFRFAFDTPNLIESKSFKLYLNSLNQTSFSGFEELASVLKRDLGAVAGGAVQVRLLDYRTFSALAIRELPGRCIDELDISIGNYDLSAAILEGACSGEEVVEEELYSHLLKSNCLVTNQPDWASVFIRYRGARINDEALLRYLVSFRQHNEFHEQCVERIFVDLMRYCRPERLSVYARYTRRGGLDINPFRSNWEDSVPNWRLARQ